MKPTHVYFVPVPVRDSSGTLVALKVSVAFDCSPRWLPRKKPFKLTLEPLAKFLENDACHVPVKPCTGDFGGQNPVLMHFH